MPKNSFFIDSCVFLGTVIKDENIKACKSFISRVQNNVYIGYISPFVTGEMINSILYADNIRPRIKSDILHAVVDMLISTKLENFVPSNNDMKIYSEIREADDRISESDIIHATCAKILGISLVTTDDMMLNSRGLKRHVDIISPADIV
jgi:predicted nucleic acid-binding protein